MSVTNKLLSGVCAAVLLAAAAAGVAPAAPQADLSNRPFTSWTKAEAEAVLNDSPWARQQTVKIRVGARSRRVAGAPVSTEGGGPSIARADLGGAEAPLDFTFTLRLRSARRVREALVRLRQIEANYDAMSAEKKAAFDAQPKIKGLLECPACAENYVLTLSARSSESPGADPVFATFKGARLAELQRYVYISDERGRRRRLVHFVPPKSPGEEATFFFPRADERGEPLLTATSRELLFNLSDLEVNSVANFRVDVSKLVAGGEVDF